MKRVILILIVLLSGCNAPEKEKKRVLEEAGIIHNEMLRKADDLQSELAELKKRSDVPADSLRMLEEALIQWRGEIIEVPGNEHHHHHEGEHHHHSSAPVTLSAAEIMAIQKELNHRIDSLTDQLHFLRD